MWIQKDKLTKETSWDKVLDWIVIDGVLWVEIAKEVIDGCIAQC
jgi:hypothetical protein